MATADLTVIGVGSSDPSAGEYIAAIQRRLAAQDKVGYEMHAMATSLESNTYSYEEQAHSHPHLDRPEEQVHRVARAQGILPTTKG